jgi:hypothetical protein
MMHRGGQRNAGNRSGRKGAGTNANKLTVKSGTACDVKTSSRPADTPCGSGRSADKNFESKLLGGDDQFVESIDLLVGACPRQRERALGFITSYLATSVRTEFVESHSEELQTNLLAVLRRGGKTSEVLGAHAALRVLAITVGWGDRSMLDKCKLTLERAAKYGSQAEWCAAAVSTLSVLCFVCSCEEADAKSCLRLLEDMGVFPNLTPSRTSDSDQDSDHDLDSDSDLDSTEEAESDSEGQEQEDAENKTEDSGQLSKEPLVQEAALLAWGLLASTLSNEYIGDTCFQPYARLFLHQLSSPVHALRLEAGENLAILFEKREAAEQVSDNPKSDFIIDQVFEVFEDLSVEGGAATNKKEAKAQRLAFRQFVSSAVHGEAPCLNVEAESESLEFNTWAQIRQVRVMRQLLGKGFVAHIHANESLRLALDLGESPGEVVAEHVFLSPNSAESKEWTRNRNRERAAKGFVV